MPRIARSRAIGHACLATLAFALTPCLGLAQIIAAPVPPWKGVGPTGAHVTVIAPDTQVANRAHLGSVGGNVFLTENGGASWSALGNGLLTTTVRQIELPTPGGVLYAGGPSEVYRWFDDEELWIQRPIPGSPTLYAMDVGRSPGNLGRVYALAANTSLIGCCSLWISDDEGATWQERPTGVFGQSFVVLDTEPATLLVAGYRFYRSTDEGATWFEAQGPGDLLPNVHQLFVDPRDPATVYALANPIDPELFESTGTWLLKSVDAGASWSEVGEGLPEPSFAPDYADLAVNPLNTDEVIVTSEYDGSFRSTDGGLNFTPLESLGDQLPEFDPGLFAFQADGALLGAADRASDRPLVFAQQATGPWTRPATTFPASTIEQVLAHPQVASDWIVRLRDGRLLRTEDGGDTWFPADSGLEGRRVWSVLRTVGAGDDLLAATTSSTSFSLDTTLYRSTDGGDTWSEWAALGADPVDQLVADPRRPDRLYALGFYASTSVSDDGGLTWSPFFETPRTEPCQFVRDLAASPHEDLLLAGCVRDSGAPVSPPIYHSDAFVSTDDGVTWQPASDLAAGRPGRDAWSFSFDPVEPALVYAALASGEFYRSEDGGSTFSRETVDNSVLGIRDVTSRAGEVLIGTVTHGVLRRVEPAIWQPINTGLTSLHIRDLEYTAAGNGRVLAGTEGGGLHVLDRISACEDDEVGSCMLDRFRVTAEWRDEHGAWHAAGAQQVAPGTGSFWFFDERNLELAVKMIDGRAVNGHFWFYAGALSDVEYRIHIVDTNSFGTRSRTYSSERGVISSLADVEAFASTGSNSRVHAPRTATGTADRLTGDRDLGSRVGVDLPLTPVPPSRQLGDYRIMVEWRLPQGSGGFGFGRGLNELTAAFWFFEPNSLDLFMKILDGTDINGHDWLFVGSLTDVGFTLHVTHDPSGVTRSYVNEPGGFAGFLDLELGPKR